MAGEKGQKMSIYEYIRKETDPAKLYDGIRERLQKLADNGKYPSDHVIKRIQREADARYSELTERKHEQTAHQFTEAIKTIASKPENLENLETYLSMHFQTWLDKFANTPETLAAEMREFAQMEI